MTPFQAAIEAARAEELDTAALVMAGDRATLVLATAWKSVPRTMRKPKRKCPADPDRRWAWLWECVDLDIGAVMRCSGLPERVCRDAFEKLRSNRLIYPDGTLNAGATQVLGAWLKQQIADM